MKIQYIYIYFVVLFDCIKIYVYAIPVGEQSKSREKKSEIEDWMLKNACNRDTCVLALGGGRQ